MSSTFYPLSANRAVGRSRITPRNPTSFQKNRDTHCESRQNYGKNNIQPETIYQSKVSRNMGVYTIIVNLHQIRIKDRLLLFMSSFQIISRTKIDLQQ